MIRSSIVKVVARPTLHSRSATPEILTLFQACCALPAALLITAALALPASSDAAPRAPTLCVDQAERCTRPPESEPPPGPVAGANLETLNARFIGKGGNDANDGRSHATRWATTSPASRLPTGTHVYLLTGTDNGKRAWRIDWGGSAADKVVIGCYYRDSENGYQVTSCHEGSLAGTLAKPRLRGTYEESCRQSRPSTCPVDSSSAVPASQWNGLIDVQASHVVIQDLEVSDASGVGIRHAANFSHTHLTVQRTNIVRTYKSGIQFNKVPNNGFPIARDNRLQLNSLQRVDGRERSWPGALLIDAAGHNTRGLVENNLLRDSGGEGIQILRAHFNVVRGNTVANIRRPLVYLDNAADNVVEHNHLVGGGYMGRDESFGVAFGLLVEPYPSNNMHDAVRNVFRNNLIANTRGGVHVAVAQASYYNCGSSPCPSAAEAGYKVGAWIQGNTVLQGKSNFLYGHNLNVNHNVDRLDIANNVFVGTGECQWPSLSSSLSTIANNGYSSEPTISRCKGSNGMVGGIGLGNASGANADNIPPISTYTLNGTSSAAHAGAARLQTILNVANYPQFVEFADNLCRPSASDWEKALALDYQCAVRPNDPDMGGLNAQ